MKRIIISEWKCLYPIKKVIMITLELFLIYISVMGIFKLYKFDNVTDYLYWGGFILFSIFLFSKIKNYVLIPYRCMPNLSKVIGRKKSEEIINNKCFVKYDGLKGTTWNGELWISENWICLQNHYIPKAGIIKMWIMYKSALNRHYYIGFLLVTGEVFQKNNSDT